MIGQWLGPTAPRGRGGRAASLVALVILVLAHLAGTVHAAAPGGSHLELAAALCAETVEPNPDVTSGPKSAHKVGAPTPDHHNSTGDSHIEHSAGRPRTAGSDAHDTPGPDAPPLFQPAIPSPDFTSGASYGTTPRRLAPDGPAARSLLCVWRQ